jgi:hypothetical protein
MLGDMRLARHSPPRLAGVLALTMLVGGFPDASAGLLPSVTSRTSAALHERPPGVPADAELEQTGAIVGEVTIVVRELFDTRLPEEDTALFRLANRLHSETRESTVRRQLLFAPGEAYQSRRLAETARLLRAQRYLRDAWVRPVAWHDGQVDIEVEVQDVWTLNPGLSFGRNGGNNSTGFEIEDLNLLGTGTQLSLARKSDVDRDSTRLVLRNRQLGRSRWSFDAEWEENSDGLLHALQLERPFYSLDTRWTAGVLAKRHERVESRYDLGLSTDQYDARTRTDSAWLGWSAGLQGNHVTRYRVGYTVDETNFRGLTAPAPTRLLPADRRLAYPWIEVERAEDSYRTEFDRDQIGRTEDVALGLQTRLRIGWLDGSSRVDQGIDLNGLVVSAAASRGWQLSERQTLQVATALDGRLDDGSLHDALLGASMQYYFRQSPRRVLYLGLESLTGFDLDADRQVLLGGDNGLRGYPLRYQSGTSRWLFTAEQRLFSNWYPFRLFNVGGAVFFDVGQVTGTDALGAQGRGVLKDVGFGLRLGNGRSALGNVIHIDLAVPLDRDPTIDNVQFLIETKRSF